MVIDLTYKCSMGCSHCMSDCNKNGEEMSLETLNDVCNFIENRVIDNRYPMILGISGGEIFEHSQIIECLDIIFERFATKQNIYFILSTNGRILSETPEYLEHMRELRNQYGKRKFFIQVTDDERFYPTKLTKKQRYRLEKLDTVMIADNVPTDKTDKNSVYIHKVELY